MPNVYERLGVRPIVNAKGPSTRLSGGMMHPEVAAAMAQATALCVDMAELQAAASAAIARATGAEAGYVTAGAAAGLLLATAACMTGLDPGRMNRLPDTTGMKNEVLVARSQRNFYDHAVRAAGARLVEIGLPDRVSGAGVRDAEPWEYADAINERTAAVLYVASPEARPDLTDVAAVAHAAGVPVIVDAAGQLPPAANLRRFVAEGADAVVFSGGKAIGGPQGSGILAGRRDLVMAAALQNLDLDIPFALWTPPPGLIDKDRLKGIPHHGIGRSSKVGKEQVVGLLAALERFAGEDDATRRAPWLARMRALADALKPLNNAAVELRDEGHPVPTVALRLAPAAGLGADALLLALQTGTPPIYADPSEARSRTVVFVPTCLQDDEVPVIARRVRDVVTAAG